MDGESKRGHEKMMHFLHVPICERWDKILHNLSQNRDIYNPESKKGVK